MSGEFSGGRDAFSEEVVKKKHDFTRGATSAGFGSDSQVATICPSSPQRKQYHGLGLVLGRLTKEHERKNSETSAASGR
ncbi:uncharacterized protein KZ484_015242 isoform 3-T6 [Pholidichthys leucotaenia]